MVIKMVWSTFKDAAMKMSENILLFAPCRSNRNLQHSPHIKRYYIVCRYNMVNC